MEISKLVKPLKVKTNKRAVIDLFERIFEIKFILNVTHEKPKEGIKDLKD